MDNYFLEGVATYLFSKNWEIAPDMRISIKHNEFEYKRGVSVVYKTLSTNWQVVNQFKWQIDIDSKGNSDNVILNRINLEWYF